MNYFLQFVNKEGLFTDEEVNELLDAVKVKHFSKNAFLQRPGQVCHHSFFVEKGLLRSYTIDEKGKEHIIQFAPESWIITDRASTYFHTPSELFIDAVEDSEVVMLDNNFVAKAATLNTEFAHQNLMILHRHILFMQKRINLLLAATAEERYLNFVELYPDILLRVPQWMVASYLGITPEGLSRVRKELASRNHSKTS